VIEVEGPKVSLAWDWDRSVKSNTVVNYYWTLWHKVLRIEVVA